MAGARVLLVFLSIFTFVNAYADYSGYKVLTVVPDDQEQWDALQTIVLQYQLDEWKTSTAPGLPADVMIPPRDLDDIISQLQSWGIGHYVMIADVGRFVMEAVDPELTELNTSKFYTVTEIYGILDDLVVTCGADCQVVTIGTSYEGRPLNVIKISRPGSGRRAIWLDGGIHAREWLTPAVTTFFADKLVNDYGIDPEVTLLRDVYDWYILPVVNPDGYEFTWTDDRMWRKTRRPNPGSSCVGTDPNRNYDYMWGTGSTDPCSEVYQGVAAESEVEIAAFSSFVSGISDSVDLVISYHTYSEILFMPWAYNLTHEPSDITDLERLAAICVDAVNANSTWLYEYGQINGAEAGISMDWTKGAAGIKYSYVMEMRGSNSYGFLAPPSEILPTSLENWAGVVAMAMDLMP